MTQDREAEEGWRGALTEPGFAPQSRFFHWLPSNPRCRVNTGQAFTGFLGPSDEVSGFTAVGDAVNVANRLGEAATAGELIVAGDELSFSQPPPVAAGERGSSASCR